MLADLPYWLQYSQWGTPVWALLALPLVIAAVWGAALGIGKLAMLFVRRSETSHQRLAGVVKTVLAPLDLLLGVWLFNFGKAFLPLSDQTYDLLGKCQIAAATVAAVWLLLRLARIGADRVGNYFDRSGKSHAKAVIPLLRKIGASAIILIGALFMLQNLGVNVAAMLAGLGIGGLALALAGQKTVENLFAGVSLVMDQPARVGDVCNYGGSSGTIEDIGLRSTRIRTVERSVVTIPNSKLAEMQIENLAWRDRILLKTLISLRYETTPAQMKAVLEGIRTMLAGRKEIVNGGRVRFVAFTENALNLELFSYVATRDFNEFLGVREEVYLSIMEIVAASGTAFASPSPPVVVETGSARVNNTEFGGSSRTSETDDDPAS